MITCADIRLCTSLKCSGNKDLYTLHRIAHNTVSSCDISTRKLWYVLVLLKKGLYAPCVKILNDMLSSIAPYTMYLSATINQASNEAKTLYLDRYLDPAIPIAKKASGAWLLDLKVDQNDAHILPLAIQNELKFTPVDTPVALSPFVLVYYLQFLCYNELCQYDNRDQALQHLVEVLNNPQQRGNYIYTSANIAGHCLLMVGEIDLARELFIWSNEFTLEYPPFNKYNSALHYLQCLSQ